MKLTISNQELDFNFRFKEVAELEKHVQLKDLQEFVSKVGNAALILSIGTGKSLDECVEILNEGTLKDAQKVGDAFAELVVKYIDPNSLTPTN